MTFLLGFLRIGNYSKVFGRWCGSGAEDVLGKVIQHLQSWPNQRCPKMQDLQADLTSHICVVNACKCIHVLKILGPMANGMVALSPSVDILFRVHVLRILRFTVAVSWLKKLPHMSLHSLLHKLIAWFSLIFPFLGCLRQLEREEYP